MSNFVNLEGKKLGRLTVIRRAENDRNKSTQWECKCDCGNTKTIRYASLASGSIKSCGCYWNELLLQRTTHKMGKTRLYRIWKGMKERCYRKNHKSKNYGDRGISVCDEWRDSFESFRDWAIGNGYSDTLTIDRLDVDGNYTPENCKWSTYLEQANNTRKTRFFIFDGEKLTVTDISQKYGISRGTINSRLNNNWDIEKIIKTPINQNLARH